MSTAAHTLPAEAINAKLISLIGTAAVFFGVFLSGFVINEPAPYELFLAGAIAIAFIFGLRIPATIAPLLALLILFVIGGMIAMTQMADLRDTPLYLAVTFFLALTAVFFAAALVARPDLFRIVFLAWTVAAMATGLLGILGYFGLTGGSFTLYDRAAGAFKDPNVFGPYLVLPATYLFHRLMTGNPMKMPLYVGALLFLSLAILLSFSRGAWGLYFFSLAAVTAGLFIQSSSGAFRLKIAVMAVVSALAIGIAAMIALQIPAIADLFVQRAQLVQDYDGARLGRFARYTIGFELAMERPLGIGALVFGRMYGEDTHNIWLKALLDYSWLGFAAYLTLIVWTLAGGFKILFRDRPWQPFLICAYVVFIGHVLLGTVIDTNHWRHFYILLGIIWAAMALEARHQRSVARARIMSAS
ncbi:MAG: O-antigen ligase family protein [Rhizobiaceae bacterium]